MAQVTYVLDLNKMRGLRLLLFASFLFTVFIGYWLTTAASRQPSNTIIQIAAAPSGSSATINGNSASIGNNSVSPGTYNIKVSKSGFATQSQTISVGQGHTVLVGLSLKPNTAKTQDWYAKHPDDQSLSDAIGSKLSDFENTTLQQSNPIWSQLPIIYGDGQGGLIKISPGVSLTANGPPAIYVYASTPQLRQGVLTYLRSHGVDPAQIDIVFKTQANGLELPNE